MKMIKVLIAGILIYSQALGQAVIPNNTVSFGKTGAADKTLEANLSKSGASTNPKIKWDNATSLWKRSNDGTTFGTIATFSDKLSNFAATSSSELAGIISDETGTGSLVYSNSPTFTTPNIGTATGSITGNAATATALAANPTDCSANNYATAIDANGNLTCATVTGTGASADNKLTNGNFENSTTGWTASAGTFTTTTTAANVFESTTAASWDSSAASQTLTGTAITVGGLAGTNAELTCMIQVPSGTATHTLGVWDGSTLSNTQTITSSATYTATTINFVVPSSGTVTPRFTSVASDEPIIYIDDCYLGKPRNIGTVSQALLAGSSYFAGTTNCSWARSSATIGAFTTDADCPGPTVEYSSLGTWATTDADLPRQTITNLPAGTYEAEFDGIVYLGAGAGAAMAINDGTTTCAATNVNQGTTGLNQSVKCTFNYTAPGTRTFELYVATSSATAFNLQNSTTSPATNAKFKLRYYPTRSQQAVSSAQADYDWTAYTPTLSAGFGTATSVSFFHKRVGGDLHVKGTFTTGTTAASTGTITLPSGLTLDTTRISIQNTSSNAGAQVGNFAQTGANRAGPIITATGTSSLLVYIGDQWGNATMLTPNPINVVLGNSTHVSVNFVVPISGWNTSQRAPTLVGSVTSNSSSAMREEWWVGTSSNCTTASCSTQSTSGTITLSRSGTGAYQADIPSGTFSAIPSCHAGSSAFSHYVGGRSLTAFNFQAVNSGGAGVDAAYLTVRCIGPR